MIPIRIKRASNPVTIPTINAQWRGCTKCVMGAHVRNHVFIDTVPRSVLAFGGSHVDMVMIGEGPGETEDTLGYPFCGPAGKLLRDLIDAAPHNACPFCDGMGLEDGTVSEPCWACRGYGRITIALLNLLACRPYKSKPLAPGNREPATSEVYNCLPRLTDTIKVLNPNTVVSVGRVADSFWPVAVMPELGSMVVHHETIKHPSFVLRTGEGSAQHMDYARRIDRLFAQYWENFRYDQSIALY
jgi:uracil-DNA glycosylase